MKGVKLEDVKPTKPKKLKGEATNVAIERAKADITEPSTCPNKGKTIT